MIDFRNQDCMQGMKEYPDKYFDLAIVDPPYGDGGGSWKRTDKSRFGGNFDKYRLEQIRRTVRPI
jgi:DNA modification methylase